MLDVKAKATRNDSHLVAVAFGSFFACGNVISISGSFASHLSLMIPHRKILGSSVITSRTGGSHLT